MRVSPGKLRTPGPKKVRGQTLAQETGKWPPLLRPGVEPAVPAQPRGKNQLSLNEKRGEEEVERSFAGKRVKSP